MGYEIMIFSKATSKKVKHNFSFLGSKQFPTDVQIARVDYFEPKEDMFIGLRLVIKSASYSKTLEEAIAGPGLTLTYNTHVVNLENGRGVQFCSYDPISPEIFKVSEGNVLYVNF